MGLFHINTHKLADVCADDKNYNNILAMQITLMRLFLYLHLHDYLLTLVLQRVHSQPQLHIGTHGRNPARTTLTSPSPSTLTIPFAHPFSRTPGFAYSNQHIWHSNGEHVPAADPGRRLVHSHQCSTIRMYGAVQVQWSTGVGGCRFCWSCNAVGVGWGSGDWDCRDWGHCWGCPLSGGASV